METIVCNLCGSNHLQSFPAASYHLNLMPPLEVKQCGVCGFIFMNPRPDAAERGALFTDQVPELLKPYASAGANYGAVTEARLPFFRKRIQVLIDNINKPVSEIRFLDVGASSGYMVEAARESGLQAWGIEPGDSGVSAANLRGITLEQGAAEELPYENNFFDIVHSHHVFEHVADPLQAAREIFRVLKPGGLFFVEVPNQFANIRFRRDQIFNRVSQRQRGIRSVHHLSFFSKSTLRFLLRQSGFKQISVWSEFAVKPQGLTQLLGWATIAAGKFFLGGERIMATGLKNKP